MPEPEQSKNCLSLKQATCNKIADWLTLLAMPGVLFFFITCAYSIYLFRTNPTLPDATHTVEEVAHSDHRFFTPLQAKICLPPLPFIVYGASFLLLIVAAFLRNGCKFNRITFFKGNR
jgi:hypothetical protein